MLRTSTTSLTLTMLLIMFSRLSTKMLSRCTQLSWWKTSDWILMELTHLLSTTAEAPRIRSLDRLTRYQTTIWGTRCLRLRLHMADSQPYSNANLLCSSRMGALSLELLFQTKKSFRSLMSFTPRKCKQTLLSGLLKFLDHFWSQFSMRRVALSFQSYWVVQEYHSRAITNPLMQVLRQLTLN